MTIECQARAPAPRSAPRMHHAALRRSGRLDVGVQAEQVGRIVTLLERGKPRVVVAVSGMRARLTIVARGEIHVLAARLRLDLRPGAPHPVDLALGVPRRHLPGREYPNVVTRSA